MIAFPIYAGMTVMGDEDDVDTRFKQGTGTNLTAGAEPTEFTYLKSFDELSRTFESEAGQ